jgi:hypothetical protein
VCIKVLYDESSFDGHYDFATVKGEDGKNFVKQEGAGHVQIENTGGIIVPLGTNVTNPSRDIYCAEVVCAQLHFLFCTNFENTLFRRFFQQKFVQHENFPGS